MSQSMPYPKRRDALMAARGQGLILVRGQGPEGVNPNFFYLTGLEEPLGALLLAPNGVRFGTGRLHPGADYQRGRVARQLLFLPRRDPLAAQWGEDAAATCDAVTSDSVGVDAVLAAEELQPLLDRELIAAGCLHYVRGAQPTLAVGDADTRFVATLRERFFGVDVQDATPAVQELRRIKDEHEIRAIERSVELTAGALARILPMVEAGLGECEIEAEIAHHYRVGGAGHAFDPIVGCGGNALLLHYRENSGRLGAGEMLLIDTGASLGGYKSDVTRSLPVDGRFTDRQREIYEIVLAAQEQAIRTCRPGTLIPDVHATAHRVIEEAGHGERFIHGTSHHLGLETHDVGDAHRPLEPGCVITVEPGIYLPEEQIGVRIEDDVLVTDGEPRVLSEAIPKSVEAIERSMQ